MSKVYEYYNELWEMGIHPNDLPSNDLAILCDGDCGNYYREKDMNYSDEGYNLCKSCMFDHVSDVERNNED